MIERYKVLEAQKQWGKGIVKIGSLKDDRDACVKFTNDFLDKMYAFDLGEVLFKPTKTSEFQFRNDKTSALSYFIAGNDDFKEDKGFAITPWKNVEFSDDLSIILEDSRAIAMGNYFFTDMNDNKVKVEYTFGYKLVDGDLKIDLHHSSVPYRE